MTKGEELLAVTEMGLWIKVVDIVVTHCTGGDSPVEMWFREFGGKAVESTV